MAPSRALANSVECLLDIRRWRRQAKQVLTVLSNEIYTVKRLPLGGADTECQHLHFYMYIKPRLTFKGDYDLL